MAQASVEKSGPSSLHMVSLSLHIYLILKLLSPGLVIGGLVPRMNVQASSPFEARSKKPHNVAIPCFAAQSNPQHNSRFQGRVIDFQ